MKNKLAQNSQSHGNETEYQAIHSFINPSSYHHPSVHLSIQLGEGHREVNPVQRVSVLACCPVDFILRTTDFFSGDMIDSLLRNQVSQQSS